MLVMNYYIMNIVNMNINITHNNILNYKPTSITHKCYICDSVFIHNFIKAYKWLVINQLIVNK